MAEATYKTRHRINLSTSVKGIVTPEVTVEIIDGDNDLVISLAKDFYKQAQALAAEVQAADAG